MPGGKKKKRSAAGGARGGGGGGGGGISQEQTAKIVQLVRLKGPNSQTARFFQHLEEQRQHQSTMEAILHAREAAAAAAPDRNTQFNPSEQQS